MNGNTPVRFLTFIVSLMFCAQSFAVQGAQTFTLDGRVRLANSNAPILDPSIRLEVQILDPSKTCVLYAEEQWVSTTGSNGYFNINIGSDIGSPKRIAGTDPGSAMASVFSNASALTGTDAQGQTCAASTYSPTTKDKRFFRILVTPSGTGVTDQLADTVFDAVPAAMVAERAESIGAYGPTDLLHVNTTGVNVLSQANAESIFNTTNFPILNALLAGTSPLYNKLGANGTAVLPALVAPSSPQAGQMWYEGGVVKYYDGTTTQTLSSGIANGVSAAAGSAAAPSISFSGDTDTGWYSPAADNLAAATGGVERVRINENGNVGIGTAAPGARLTISGTISAPAWTSAGIGIRQNSGVYTDTSSSGVVGFNFVNAFGIPTLAASSATTYTNASAFSIYPPTAGANVSIGTSSALTVNSAALTGVTTGIGLVINAPTGATNNYAALFSGGAIRVAPSALPGTAAAGDIAVDSGDSNKFKYFNGTAWIAMAADGSGVLTFNGRAGAVAPAANDYTWAQIDKTTSSFADIATRSATDINSGTLADARLTSNVVLKNAVNVFSVGAQQINIDAAGVKGLIVKAAAGQTATLTEWQNNAGAALYTMDASGTPTAATDLTNKGYVDTAIGTAGSSFVLKAGDTMTGQLTVPAFKVSAGALPGTPAAGNIAIDSGDANKMKYYDGAAWVTLGVAGAGVNTFNGRAGAVSPAANDYTWAQIDKTTSSIADLATRSATDINSGTLADARLTSNVVLKDQVNVFSKGAQQINIDAAGVKGLIVKAAAGQTATLTEWQDNAGAALYTMDAAGSPTAATDLTDVAFVNGAISTAAANYVAKAGDTMTGTLNVPANGIKVAAGALTGTPAAGQIAIDSGDSNKMKYYDGAAWVTLGVAGAGVNTFNGRAGAVSPAANDYTWAQIDKTTSSIADLATRSATDINSGTLADARLSANVALRDNANNFSAAQVINKGGNQINIDAAAAKGLIVKAAAGQTASLTEWQDNSGAALYTMDAAGTPTAATDLADKGYVDTAIASNNLNSSFIKDGNSFGATAVLGTNDNNSLAFETNGTTKVTILPSGNVGIGTAAPNRLLEVNGAIRVNAAALPGTPGTGDIAIDSGDANKLKYYDGSAWQTLGISGAGVVTFNGRAGAVSPAANDYTWAQIDKSTSSFADIATRSATDINSGTLADARLSANVALRDNANNFSAAQVFNKGANQINIDAAGVKGLIVKAAAGQTASLTEWQNNAGAALYTMDPTGVPGVATDLADKGYVDTAIAGVPAGVTSFNTRTGAITPAANDYTWAQIDKSTSSFADIATRSATDINSGTLADARLTSNVVLKDQVNVFSKGAQQINIDAAGVKGLIIKAAAGQTANVTEWQDNAGAALYTMAANGVPSAATDVTDKAYVDGAISTSGSSYVLKAGDTMTGALVNNTNSASTALAITQSGAGNAATFMGGNVGIGTTAPATKLHIRGLNTGIATPSNSQLLIEDTVSSYVDFKISDNSTAGMRLSTPAGQTSSQLLFQGPTSATFPGAMQFVTGAANRMIIDASGNVGVGTTSPARLLHVAGSVRFNPSALPGTPAAGDIAIDSGDSNQLKYYNGSAWQTLGVAGSGVITFNGRAGAVSPAANDYTWAQIDKSTSSIADLATRSATDINSGTLADARLTSNVVLKDQVNVFSKGAQQINIDAAGVKGLIVKAAAGQTASLTEWQNNAGAALYTMDPGGVPTAATDVADKGYVDTAIATNNLNSAFVKDGNSFGAAATLGTNDNFDLNFETNGTNKMIIEADGDLAVDTSSLFVDATSNRVGIGTAAPNMRLHVLDSAQFGDTTTNNGTVYVKATNETSAFVNVAGGTATSILYPYGLVGNRAGYELSNSQVGGNVNIKVSNAAARDTTAMHISSAGNVGIGTVTPARLLHVNGPIRVAASALPGTPATGDIAIDSGDSNQLKYYNGSAWQTLGVAGSGVITFNGRAGAVSPAANDYTWAQIDKSTSSFADIATRSATDINSGTLADARLTSNVVLKDQVNVFSKGAQQINIDAAGVKGLIIKAAASQTASLTEWQNSAGTALYTMDPTGVPTAATDVADKGYVDTAVSTAGSSYVLKAGDTMSGALSMGTSAVQSSSALNLNSDSDNAGSDGGFNFKKNGTNLMTINDAGDVNIASTTASVNYGTGSLVLGGGLGVGGAIRTNGNLNVARTANNAYASSSGANAAPSGALMEVQNNSSNDLRGAFATFTAKNTAGNNQEAYIGAYSVTGAGQYSPALVFGLQTGATAYQESMRVDSTGNVGIGTTGPNAKLDVNGAVNIGGGTGTAGTYILNFANAPALNSASSVAGITGEVNNSGSGSVGGMNINAASSYVGTTAGVNGVAATIRNYAGNTLTAANAIYTGSPVVGGAITTSTGVYIAKQKMAGVTNGYGIYQADSGDMNSFAGNVGIGVTNPARLLHVAGPIRIAASALPGSPAAGDLAVDSGAGNALKWYDGSNWQTVGTSTGGVTSFNSRTGAVSPATNDYTWAQIDKSTSSFADIATRSATDINAGTLADARLTSNVVLKDQVNVFSKGAQQINIDAAGVKGLIVKAAASQTASLTEWQNSAGTALYTMDPTGVPTLATDVADKGYVDTAVSTAGSSYVLKAGDSMTGALAITSTSANALAVGANGTTNPVLQVDASGASAATGVKISGSAAGTNAVIRATSSAANEGLIIGTKGNGGLWLDANSTGVVNISNNGSLKMSVDANSISANYVDFYSFGTRAATAGSNTRFKFFGVADTTLQAGQETMGMHIDMAQTRQHATAGIALQRDVRVSPSTHSFVGASTLTNAAALAVDGPSNGGTNATITNSSAIYVPTSALTNVTNSYGLNVAATTGATNNYAATFSGGNVGIGTASPARLLHVAGPIRIAASALPGSPAAGDLAVDSGAGNALKWYDGSNWQTVGTSSGGVTSFNSRTGAVTPATNDYTWAQIDKSTSSFADIATRSATDINAGTLADARLTSNVVLKDQVNVFSKGAQQINIDAAGVKGLIVKAAASQTASLTEWQNSAGTALYTMDPTGVPTAATDVADKGYVDTAVSTAGSSYVLKAGDTMTGALVNNTNSASTALAITQAGAGYAATFMGGNVGIGTASPGSLLDLAGAAAKISMTRSSNDTSGAKISIAKDRAGAIVQNGDTLSALEFRGYDGSALKNAAQIATVVDGVPGANDMPGALQFMTTPDGSSSLATRMTINNAGNVGIGTTSPGTVLDAIKTDATVYASSSGAFSKPQSVSALSITNDDGTNGTAAYFRMEAKNAGSVYGIGYIGTVNSANNYKSSMVFGQRTAATAYSESMRIDESGNLGIGVTNPARLLHVNGPMRVQPAALPGTPAAGDIAIDSGAGNALKYHDGTNWIALGSGTGDFLKNGSVTMTGNIRLGGFWLSNDGGNEGVWVHTNGYTGIGTSSPASLLANTNTTIADAGGGGMNTPAGLSWEANGGGYTAAFTNAGVAAGRNGVLVKTGATDTGSYIFKAESGGTNKFAIRADGKVGIGTTAPLSTFDVSGNAVIGSGYAGSYAAPTDGLMVQGNSSFGTTITTGAKVDVGTGGVKTANYTAINVDNAATTSTASVTKTGLNIQSTGAWTGASAVNVGLNVNATGGTTNYAATFMGGNVGIGTVSPNRLLEVAGPIRIAASALPGTPAAGDIAIDSGASNALKYYNGSAWISLGSGTGDFLKNGSVAMTGNFQTGGNWISNDGGNEGIGIDTSGNVGVGTLTPSQTGAAAKMHVAGGNLKLDASQALTWDGTFPTSISGVSGSSGYITMTPGNTGYASAKVDVGYMTLTNTNNSGTVYDILRLDRSRADATAPVAGFGAGVTFGLEGFTNSSSATAGRVSAIWENTQANDTTDRDSALTFETMLNNSVSEKMRISSAGNVGIGTTSPSQKLSVHAIDADTHVSIINESSTVARYPGPFVQNFTGGNGGAPSFTGFAARGTFSSPQPVSSGDNLLMFNGLGQTDTGTGYGTGALIQMQAAQNFTTSAYGTNILFSTAATGSTSVNERFRVSSNGGIRLTPAALPGTPAAGDIAIDSGASNALKYYNGSSWISLTGGGTGDFLKDGTIAMTGTLKGLPGSAANPGYTFTGFTGTGMLERGTDILGLSTAGTERLTILADGKVGIGATTPGFDLDVAGTIQALRATAGQATALILKNTNTAAGSGVAMQMMANSVVGASITTDIPVNSNNVDLAFSTRGSSSSSEKMRILANGNVGINETVPGGKLQINSDATGTKPLIVKAFAGQTATLTEWQNSAGTALYTMDAAGTPTASTDLVTKSFLTGYVGGGSSYVLKAGDSMTGALAITSNSATALAVGRNGTTDPAFSVDDSTASAATGIAVQAKAAGSGVVIQTTSSAANENITIKAKANGYAYVDAGNSVVLSTGGTQRASFNSSMQSFGNSPLFGWAAATKTSTAMATFGFASGGGSSALTASTDVPIFLFDGTGGIQQHSTGAIALQRDFSVLAATHSAVAASTLTNAATFAVDGPPKAGSNATITNSSAIYVPTSTLSGSVTNGYGLNVTATTGATNNYAATFMGGNVGIGTATPAAALDVLGNSMLLGASRTTNASKYFDILAPHYSSGTNVLMMSVTNKTVANYLDIGGGGSNYGSVNGATEIGFYTATNNAVPTSSVERMIITSSGNIGMGTLAPTSNLAVTPLQYSTGTASQSTTTVTGSGTTWTSAMVGSQFVFNDGTNAGTITAFGSATSLTVSTSQTIASQGYKIGYMGLQVASNGRVGIGTDAPGAALHVVGDIQYTGVLTDISDRRLKKNITPLGLALPRVRKIKTYSYVMKDDPKEQIEYGVIAQEIQDIIPELVRIFDEDGNYIGVNYTGLIPWTIRAIQEVDAENQKLKAENVKLAERLSALEQEHKETQRQIQSIIETMKKK